MGHFRFHFDAKVKWSVNASDQKAYYSTSPQNFCEMKVFVPFFFFFKQIIGSTVLFLQLIN